MDPYSPEADALLERHRAEALEVSRIRRAREIAEQRQRAADRMARALHDLAQAYYDYGSGSDEVHETAGDLGDLLQDHTLPAAQRADVWAYVAAFAEQWGW